MDHEIVLEPEQEELLCVLVEASRSVPSDQRQAFIFLQPEASPLGRLIHPGLDNNAVDQYRGDVDVLLRAELLIMRSSSRTVFDVLPEGFAYYATLQQRRGEPMERLEGHVRRLLDSLPSSKSAALDKWRQAEQKLWSEDPEREFTQIGHLCREAMQEYASALVEKHKPPGVRGSR